ncbi:putative pumilio/PUF RNA binding protein 7 [Trypanosoma conorhini]|uniref:Putative pumilio/PUF RNA binding protein 7 n=1 Tax=Trypanosoma conorhini TaxID=83891 RepID=A0A422PB82_9TRYP|nr:putative pumilio/PUF RNA binding protein 7 [Trypanosoma conorhini]RNF14960.1 putative pumilio/PUF RNA binding protein 7 [Trypanosoma conorhini]
MPGMRLDFLKNPSQRAATGKSMPLKQVEAILLYGKPEQRAKVVQKILPNTYSLCLSKASHYLLLTLLTKCDGLVRVQMLYHVRRKIIDLSLSPVGNTIVQEMLEHLPVQQKREIAEMFVLNTEDDEFRRLCEHAFGNHVAQKIMEHPVSREVVEERFLPHIPSLAVHPYGQRVVVKYMESAEDGWRAVSQAVFATDGELDVEEAVVGALFRPAEDNMTVSALLKHPLVSTTVKDALCAHLCEFASEYLQSRKETTAEDEFALPDFGGAAPRNSGNAAERDYPRHYHAYVTVFEQGDLAQKRELWESLLAAPGLLERIVTHKTAVAIAVAAIKTLPESQERLWAAATTATGAEAANGSGLDILDVARDPARTMLLRAMMEVHGALLTAEQRKRLAGAALELSQNPVSSPVLQKLLECFPEDVTSMRLMLGSIRAELPRLVTHNAASYLIQAMLQYGAAGAVREELVNALLDVFSDMHAMLSFAQGSRVMQKLLAYASDEAVVTVVNALLREAEEERNKDEPHGDEGCVDGEQEGKEADDDADADGDEDDAAKATEKAKPSRREQREINRKKHYEVTSRAIVSYALHSHACYVIQALLRECRGRQLEPQRKQLMSELKPFVFELAVSPWAGRIVLEAMLQSGSAKLGEVMKNVVFLKAEAWLSDVPEKGKRSGSGLDPTMRQALRRHREEPDAEKHAASAEGNAKAPTRKKLYRTLKK